MRHLPSPSQTAMLTALLIQRYAKGRGKEVSRFRLARRSLRRLAIRSRLEEGFLLPYIESMLTEYGWLTFDDGDEFFFVKWSAASGWSRIGTRLCDDLVVRLRSGDDKAIRDAEAEVEPDPEEDEEDDE